MRVNIDGKILNIDKPTRVIDLIDNKDKNIMCCSVNHSLRNLNYVITTDSFVELYDLNTSEGVKTYQASLRYIVVMACKNVLPKAKLTYNYSVSRSIFTSVSGLGHSFTYDNFNAIKEETDRLISLDLPIEHLMVSKDELLKVYEEFAYYDKIRFVEHETKEKYSLYKCNDYYNYMFGPLVPSTGYIKLYELKQYAPGFLIIYPRGECKGSLPQFEDEKTFRAALKEANRWANISKTESISRVNGMITEGSALELINLCETRHNAQLTHLGDKIEDHIDNIKVICVAGPSSSGKTTFTNRLKIELKSRGIEPFMISMDDFYKDDNYPLDEDGKPDYEHIDSLNLGLFDEIILKLVSKEEVSLPKFDFATHSTTFSDPIKLKDNQPILIEGIHGLNPNIMPSIPDEQKYRIYIAPLGQYRFDSHNPISISDIRLIRRMVRDHFFRSTDISKTINTWSSVRRGEFKWIYPYQNNADFVFNSELTYEIPVLKKYAIPELKKVPKNSEAYMTASRLLKFLNFFNDISDKWVPTNSILREFIGDSIFYTEDKI